MGTEDASPSLEADEGLDADEGLLKSPMLLETPNTPMDCDHVLLTTEPAQDLYAVGNRPGFSTGESPRCVPAFYPKVKIKSSWWLQTSAEQSVEHSVEPCHAGGGSLTLDRD